MRIPTAYPLVSLAFGIVVAECFPSSYSVVAVIASCVLIFFGLLIQRHKEATFQTSGKDTTKFLCVIGLALVCLGYALAIAQTPGNDARHYTHRCVVGERYLLSVRIAEPPSQSSKTVKFTAKVEQVKDSAGWHTSCGKLIVFAARDAQTLQLQAGDKLLMYTLLKLPSNAANPHQFDYRKYLRHKGILWQCYITSAQYHLIEHDTYSIASKLARLRNYTRDIITHTALTSGQQGITEALLLGWKDDVDETTQAQFRDAGITHLLCVSGLHVGIVSVLIGWCLSFLPGRPRSRILKGFIQMIGVWFFVALSGMAPSAMRAGLMFSFIIVGKMMSNPPPTLNVIASSALVLLVAHPSLLFDVGFELSYSAVIGIVVLNRPMQNLLPLFATQSNINHLPQQDADSSSVRKAVVNAALWLGRKFWALVCVSTSAQLATLPLVLYYFHQFPLYFLIANVTIVPFAGVLMATLIAMVLLSWFPLVAHVLAWTLSAELKAINNITCWVSQLPHALIEGIYFDGIMAVLCGLLLVALAWKANNREKKHAIVRWSMLGLSLLLVVYIVAVCLGHKKQQKLIVYSTPHTTAVEYISRRKSLLVVANRAKDSIHNDIGYQRDNNMIYCGVKHSSTVYLRDEQRWRNQVPQGSGNGNYLMLGSTKMLVVDRSNCAVLRRRAEQLQAPHFSERLKYIVFSETPYISVAQLCKLYDFDTLIIAFNNSPRYRAGWHKECAAVGVGYYDVAEQGAFVREFR